MDFGACCVLCVLVWCVDEGEGGGGHVEGGVWGEVGEVACFHGAVCAVCILI